MGGFSCGKTRAVGGSAAVNDGKAQEDDDDSEEGDDEDDYTGTESRKLLGDDGPGVHRAMRDDGEHHQQQ